MWWVGRQLAKLLGQVRLLDGLLQKWKVESGQILTAFGFPLSALKSTLEPDGQAAGCNPVEVGSTPTGVFVSRNE